MTKQDYQNQADLLARVAERTRAMPELNTMAPQEALVHVLRMIEHEYRSADQIMPTA